MKAYCLTTGHCIVCHCCCILPCYALCFLILLALKSSVFFWLLPLHFCRFKKHHLSVLFVLLFRSLSLFFHFFFHFFVRIVFVFFSLFFFFVSFSAFFFRFFPRENAIFDFQQKPEKLPKNEVQKTRKKNGKKKRKKKRTKNKKKTKKKTETKTQIFTQSPPPFLLRVPAFPPVDSCFVFSVSCVACLFLAFVLMFRL